MTENIIDQTPSAILADQSSVGQQRPAAPEGSVYLSDVLVEVRQHARDNGWCCIAEFAASRALNEGLSFKPFRLESDDECGSPTCGLCDREDTATTNADLSVERFTPAEGTDPFITKARLKKAIRKAIELGYDWDEPRRLYSELIDTYGLDEVPLATLTHTVTFTVTDEQLLRRGRTADRAGLAYTLESGATTSFTLSTESAEQTTPTLTS